METIMQTGNRVNSLLDAMPQRSQSKKLDEQIWFSVCNAFHTDRPFELTEAVVECRKDVKALRMLPFDYVVGRVYMALLRIELTTADLALIGHHPPSFTLPGAQDG